MGLGEPIKLRLDVQKQYQYEEEAAALGLPLSTYLRQRLERGDDVAGQLGELRRAIADIGKRDPSADSQAQSAGTFEGGNKANTGLLVELVLLLRSIVPADKLNVVHGELRRQNLPVWNGARGLRNPQKGGDLTGTD
ncbi:mobilization protein [Burkholderia multivorans]|uniref:mobilization protein n=1 Tax=Burkholderia multivorans TaxID=87883 RepID=UPI001C280BA5|nr:mobilization protein [Burkholderia multivorans]MBU9348639.1 mobilization protein [Burkholderia multivorans]